jgi:hypothetical protein
MTIYPFIRKRENSQSRVPPATIHVPYKGRNTIENSHAKESFADFSVGVM